MRASANGSPARVPGSVPAITPPIETSALRRPIIMALIPTLTTAIRILPMLMLPTLRPVQAVTPPTVPALRPIQPTMSVVILRGQLPLITRRQIRPILPMLRVGAAWIVPVRSATNGIAGTVRLVDPDASGRIGLHRYSQAQAQQQHERSDVHEAPPGTNRPRLIPSDHSLIAADRPTDGRRAEGSPRHATGRRDLYGRRRFPIIAAF